MNQRSTSGHYLPAPRVNATCILWIIAQQAKFTQSTENETLPIVDIGENESLHTVINLGSFYANAMSFKSNYNIFTLRGYNTIEKVAVKNLKTIVSTVGIKSYIRIRAPTIQNKSNRIVDQNKMFCNR